jgi:hypothetical protein
MRYLVFKGMMLAAAAMLFAQQPAEVPKKAVQGQSPSTFSYILGSSSESVDITNVAYEVVGPGIPGRPGDERLTLRVTTRTKQVVGEIGMEAMTAIAAWPLGNGFNQTPLYSLAVSGVDARTMNGEIFVISRGVEQVDWWSIYRLGTGQHLFDTYTPLVQFSLSRQERVPRYVGLEVPPDNTPDARLKAANVVGVLTYASPERVIRETLITADNPKTATLLRSYSDSTRSVSVANGRITVSIVQNQPASSSSVSLTVPIAGDDLDLARSQKPKGIQLVAWQRE